MTCTGCGAESSRVRYIPGLGEFCHLCGNFSETGGTMDGVLTRSSQRVRSQALKHEGDTLPAHRYNKVTRRMEVNPEFVKLHAISADSFITPAEAKAAGMPKLAKHIETIKKTKSDLKRS